MVDGQVVVRGYRFGMRVRSRQSRVFIQHAGAQRFAHNFAVATFAADLAEQRSDPAVKPRRSRYDFWPVWSASRDDVAGWWDQNPKTVYLAGFASAATAIKNWSDSHTGNRAGRKSGFPKFKARGRCRLTIGYANSTVRLVDETHIGFPAARRNPAQKCLSSVKVMDRGYRRLVRRTREGKARILNCTVTQDATGNWFASLQVEEHLSPPRCRRPQQPRVAGIDMGLMSLAVMDDGTVIENPKHYDAAQRRLRRQQRSLARRQGPVRAKKGSPSQKPSNNYLKQKRVVAATHKRVRNLRRDGQHKLTRRVVESQDVLGIESLSVSNMMKNRRLARTIADAGWTEIVRQIDYKMAWSGGRVVQADRWFPSSKRCSVCGYVLAELNLKVRRWVCPGCGTDHDRDVNAAVNLRQLAEHALMFEGMASSLSDVAGGRPETQNACGPDVSPASLAVGVEAGTPMRPSRA